MRFECGLVYEEMVEAAVEAILVDLFIPKLQQIGKRRAPIPILGNVQFARRLAESCKHKHRRHLCPSDMLLSNRQKSLTYLLKARPTPQRQRQIHVAKLPRALNANAFQTHRDGQMFAAIVEQRSLLGSTDQSVRKPPRLDAAMLIKLAKLRNRLLNDAPTDTYTTHEAPIAVNLPVLPYCRVAQIHAPNQSDSPLEENSLGWHCIPKSGVRAS